MICECCGQTVRGEPALVIPEIGPSLNEYFSSKSWRANHRVSKSFHELVELLARTSRIAPASGPVELSARCTFGPGRRRFDAVNLGPTVKMIEDGLRGAGVLVNDSPKYVPRVSMEPVKGDETKTEIWLTPTNPR